MEHLTALDMSLNKTQPGSGSGANINTSTEDSARRMDSATGGATGLACRANNDVWTCYNHAQICHISCNYPNHH